MNPSMCPKSFVWNSHLSDILPSSEDSIRFAAQALAEVKVADLGTAFALPTTTLGTSAALDQQVQVAAENRRTLENSTGAQTPPAGSPCGSCGSTTGTCEDSCSAPQRSSPGSVCQRVSFKWTTIEVLDQ